MLKSIEGVPPENLLNFDETNLSDDPGRKKVLMKKGTKYPERIMSHSKSAVSIIFFFQTKDEQKLNIRQFLKHKYLHALAKLATV